MGGPFAAVTFQINARLDVCRARMKTVSETRNPVDREMRMRMFGDALIDAGAAISDAQRVVQDVLQVWLHWGRAPSQDKSDVVCVVDVGGLSMLPSQMSRGGRGVWNEGLVG